MRGASLFTYTEIYLYCSLRPSLLKFLVLPHWIHGAVSGVEVLVSEVLRCVVDVRHQAVTQVKQFGAGSVLGWVTAGLRSAYRNAEREVIFSETVD